MNYNRKKNTYILAFLAAIVVMLVLHLVIYQHFTFSEGGRIDAENKRIASINKEVARLKTSLEVRRSSESGKTDYVKRAMKAVAPFSVLFVDNPGIRVGEILTEIQGLARDAGVIFTRLDTENETSPWSRELDKEVLIHLGLKGDYKGVVKFLWSIRTSGWCFIMRNFDFTSRGDDTGASISLGIAFAKS